MLFLAVYWIFECIFFIGTIGVIELLKSKVLPHITNTIHTLIPIKKSISCCRNWKIVENLLKCYAYGDSLLYWRWLTNSVIGWWNKVRCWIENGVQFWAEGSRLVNIPGTMTFCTREMGMLVWLPHLHYEKCDFVWLKCSVI